MEYRNAAFNAHGTIDLEIEHPVHGWVPFTASPDDPEQLGRDIFTAAVAGAEPYVQPVVPLAVVKAARTSAVEQEKETRISAGFVFGSPAVLYQSRPEDRENLAAASTAALGAMVAGAQSGNLRWASPDVDFEWIAADNSKQPMDAQTMFALGQTAMAHKQAHIFAAFEMKRAIEAATTIEALDAIDIHAGWPPNG